MRNLIRYTLQNDHFKTTNQSLKLRPKIEMPTRPTPSAFSEVFPDNPRRLLGAPLSAVNPPELHSDRSEDSFVKNGFFVLQHLVHILLVSGSTFSRVSVHFVVAHISTCRTPTTASGISKASETCLFTVVINRHCVCVWLKNSRGRTRIALA